jgi:hypothetical protein
MSDTVQIAREDLEALCNAITSNHFSEVEKGRNAYLDCNYCEGYCFWDDDPSKINHSTWCIYLLASAIKDSLNR